jgi:N-6 DNA Methylase
MASEAKIPGFFRAPREWEADEFARAHGHYLLRAWHEFDLWGVLCIEGRPMVYFKSVAKREPTKEADWHRRLWNHGIATMLVVEDSQEVRIFSALAKPRANAPASTEDERLVAVLDQAAFASELLYFVRSVETGRFYLDHVEKFKSDASVDSYLLENLGAARDEMCDETFDDALAPATAHAFLGRCLFTSYLLEREIIGSEQLAHVGAPTARTLRKLFDKVTSTEAIRVLYALFGLLQEDFNGSLFGLQLVGERRQMRARHIEVVRRLFSGDDFATRQPLLPGLDLYDFRLIPIEFISAIYEDFLAAEASESTEATAQSRQRKTGAFYTPPRLAGLVVDVATRGWTTLLDKRCLDPTCGSGIFLVILFQRMADEWRRRHPRAKNIERAQALRDLLTKNLCGVDRDNTACMVACFSLYLGFLDQFDEPSDIWELKRELERAGTAKVLPPLLVSRDEPATESATIHAADFFDAKLGDLGEFDLIIGNPPWIGRQQSGDLSLMEQWLLSERNPAFLSAPKARADRLARFIPEKQSAVAFLWKTPIHAKENGRICLLLPSRVFLSLGNDTFQAAWFRRFTMEHVWLLADYRRLLFAGAICPALIASFKAERPDREVAQIDYLVPKVDRLDPRRAGIVVLPDDRKQILLRDVIANADAGTAAAFWKKHYWGTGRDLELIDRLLALPRLGALAGKPGKARWNKGGGFQVFHEGTTTGEPKSATWSSKMLYLDSRAEAVDLLLLPSDCGPVPAEFRDLRREIQPELTQPPLVIFNRPGTKIAFADFPVVFRHTYFSISGPADDADLLLFLTAVLNSPLCLYFLFHTTANLGIERETALLDEYMRVPFPLPQQTRDPTASRDIVRKVAKRLRAARRAVGDGFRLAEQRERIIADAKAETTELVFQYYQLAEWEQKLVRDTVEIFKPSATPDSLHSDIPTLRRTDRMEQSWHRDYAAQLCRTINGWAQRQSWKLEASLHISSRLGLGLLTLRQTPTKPSAYQEKSAGVDFNRVLERLQKASLRRQGCLSFLRGFALIEERTIHILKPLNVRHWTQTAALNDADNIVEQMLANTTRD